MHCVAGQQFSDHSSVSRMTLAHRLQELAKFSDKHRTEEWINYRVFQGEASVKKIVLLWHGESVWNKKTFHRLDRRRA
jgi:hypothetical protein